MSTKTTFKRIALVAVAALGFGVLTSVSPARADGPMELATSIAAGTSESHRGGVFAYTPIVINLPSTAAAGDTVVVGVALLTAPATSTLASVSANPTQSAYVGATNASAANLDILAGTSGSGSFGAISAAVYSTSGSATATAMYTINAADSAGQITLRVGFKPDVSGSYTFLVSTPNAIADVTGSPAGGGAAYYSASSADTSTAFSIATTGTATGFTLAAVTTGAPSGTGQFGQLFKLTPTIGATNTLLGSTETITLSTGDSSVTFAAAPHDTVASGTATLVVSRGTAGWSGGSFFFRVDNSSATSESVSITATGSGTLSSAVTSAIGTTFTAVSAATVAYTSIDGTAAGVDTSAVATSGSTADARAYTVAAGDGSHSLRATITTAAAHTSSWTITDTSRKITGYATGTAAKFGRSITHAAADTLAYKDITVAAVLNVVNGSGESFTATHNGTTSRTITFTAANAASDAIAVTNSNRRVATGSTNSFTAALTNQFGGARANQTVVVTIAGRNGATASSSLVTNADGEVTYSLTDTGTVGTTDTITFTNGSVTGTATLSYGTTTVTTLDILGPNDSAANTADTNVTLSERVGINVAVGGASGTVGTVTVTAKDANGVVMSGVPVTFTVAGATAAILSTKALQYTAADGTASTSVYAWANGSYVVTAVAGGKTSTSTVFFAQKDATAARTISAVVSGGTITATVKDRYGNPVPSATVWATKTGTGYFGSGSSSTSGATSEAGTVDFYVNGSASVVLALGSSSAADVNYGQSGSVVGYVKQGDAGVSTIVTASAAGTATTAEKGVGAAFAASVASAAASAAVCASDTPASTATVTELIPAGANAAPTPVSAVVAVPAAEAVTAAEAASPCLTAPAAEAD
jgi:trimeric autotransporter adhesin